MTASSAPCTMTEALDGLLEKYGVRPVIGWRLLSAFEAVAGDDWLLAPATTIESDEPCDRVVPLLPWRAERRFVELKRLVDEKTVVPLVMGRLARFTDGGESALPHELYRMLDLCEWLAGDRIVTVFATITQGGCANVLCRRADGVVTSIEVSGTLPAGSEPIDRHELIARRGVACDRVVDTQVPQSSVYLLADGGAKTYTDTDAELIGLPSEQVFLVRAAYRVLSEPELAEQWRNRHRRLRGLVRLAINSDRRRQRLAVEGA